MKRLIFMFMSNLFSLTLGVVMALGGIPTISEAQSGSGSYTQPAPGSYAQPAPAPVATTNFSQAQLDQLLAPIALYPDPLLTKVLMATSYPNEVAQAAAYTQKHPSIATNRKVMLSLTPEIESQPWDDSVKFLVQFPDVLAMMNSQPDWMQQLGDAFVSNQAAVMDTVQRLRNKALELGNLTGCNQKVVVKHHNISILPTVQNEIYVPYYNPRVVYGTWWWPEVYYPFVWWPPIEYRPLFISAGFVFPFGYFIADPFFYPIIPIWDRHVFVFDRWAGHPNWIAGSRWSADTARRATALSTRTAGVQGRLQTATPSRFLPGNRSLNQGGLNQRGLAQRGLTTNRAAVQRSTGFSRATGTHRISHASSSQRWTSQHGAYAHGGARSGAYRSGGGGGFSQPHAPYRGYGGGGPHYGGGGPHYGGGGPHYGGGGPGYSGGHYSGGAGHGGGMHSGGGGSRGGGQEHRR